MILWVFLFIYLFPHETASKVKTDVASRGRPYYHVNYSLVEGKPQAIKIILWQIVSFKRRQFSQKLINVPQRPKFNNELFLSN